MFCRVAACGEIYKGAETCRVKQGAGRAARRTGQRARPSATRSPSVTAVEANSGARSGGDRSQDGAERMQRSGRTRTSGSGARALFACRSVPRQDAGRFAAPKSGRLGWDVVTCRRYRASQPSEKLPRQVAADARPILFQSSGMQSAKEYRDAPCRRAVEILGIEHPGGDLLPIAVVHVKVDCKQSALSASVAADRSGDSEGPESCSEDVVHDAQGTSAPKHGHAWRKEKAATRAEYYIARIWLASESGWR